MTRMLLRALNGPALLLLTLVAIAFQTSFFSFWILPDLQPDFALLMVVWFAMRREMLEGGVLTMILATVAESHSGAPRGVFLIAYMTVFLVMRLAAKVLVMPDLLQAPSVAFFAAVLARIATRTTIGLLGVTTVDLPNELFLLACSAFVNGAIGRYIFRLLHRFDFLTYKGVRPDQILDELAMGGEQGEIAVNYEFKGPEV